MNKKSSCLVLAVLISSSSFAFTDSLWTIGAESYPGDLVTVEVWLEYEGSGPGDSMGGFDIPLTWDANVCTVEAITIGPDFSAWPDHSRIDNQGTQGPPSIPKVSISAVALWAPYVERGVHLAATLDFRIQHVVNPGDSTYIDTLREAFSPPQPLGFVNKSFDLTYTPSYAGGWIIAAFVGDVGATSIVNPPSGVFPDSTYFPSAVIKNFSRDSLGPIPVVCTIGSWADTVEVAGIPRFDSAAVTFVGWTVPRPGIHTVTIVTQYPGDANGDNDTLSVAVRGYLFGDVGPGTIEGPPDTLHIWHTYVPSTVIRNFGVDSAGPFSVACSINSWTDVRDIPIIGGSESTIVDFDAWTVCDTGAYTVTILTQYPADTNILNDAMRKAVQALTYPPGPEILWQQTHGGDSLDGAYSVQQTSDGGYIIAGATQSFGEGWNDMYLVRTDTIGFPVWTKTYGSRYNDEALSVQQTSDGGYIVAGYYSMDPGQGEMWLIKTDASGDSSWSRHVGTGLYRESGHSVRQTYDGGYIAVGSRRREGYPNNDVYLVKMSGSGGVLWTRSYGEGWAINEWGYAVEETADSGYVIAGRKQSSGDADVYVIKTDRDGEVLWERTYGGDSADIGWSVKQATDGGYIVAGETKSFGKGKQDVYVIRVDESGNLMWERAYGGPEDDVGHSLGRTSDCGYVITGKTHSFDISGGDVWLIKIDADGNVICAETYGGRNRDWGRSVEETSDGGYIIAGFTKSFGGGGDVYLIKTKGWVGIQEETLPERHFLVCMGRPNPFSDKTSIQYELPERREVCITIYNLLGQEVKTLLKEQQPAGLHTVIWNATDNSGRRVPSGTYFLRLKAHTGLAAGPYTVTRKLCVVR